MDNKIVEGNNKQVILKSGLFVALYKEKLVSFPLKAPIDAKLANNNFFEIS